MGKIMKPGRVVLTLGGRYAGRKAVVVKVLIILTQNKFLSLKYNYSIYFKTYDDGSTDRPYAHCLVAGVDRYPRKVTKRMGKKKMEKRSKLKPFVRVYNYNHLMPTRFLKEKNQIFYNLCIFINESLLSQDIPLI